MVMATLKKILRILPYISFVFIVYYLYSFNYFALTDVSIKPLWLILSIAALWLGFVVSTLSWKKSLTLHNYDINANLAIYSHGISVFAKYIPGKIWVILGRASIVSDKTGSLSKISTISLKEQLIYLLSGLIISSLTFIWVEVNPIIIIVVLGTTISLFIFLFSKKIHNYFLHLFSALFKKTIEIPYISIKETFPVLRVILGYWLLWSLGFYFLSLSVIGNAPLLVAFAFPISVCYGLLSVIVPGGIGIREGIIVFILTSIGLDPSLSIIISLIQRLWFISGEIFIFCLALLSKQLLKKEQKQFASTSIDKLP